MTRHVRQFERLIQPHFNPAHKMERTGTVHFHPMPGKLVVELITDEQIGKIILPPQAQNSRVMGKIMEIGGDEDEGDLYPLAVGDTVLFGRSAGVEITVDRQKVLILRTSEVLCKLSWTSDLRPTVADGVGQDE